MLGGISERYVELIDIGSTGRGTNISGDGDFDFMLKCANPEEQEQLIAKIKKVLDAHEGHAKGGTNLYNIRYEDIKLDGLELPLEVDVTSAQKKMEITYSSDVCVKERLDSIREKYGEEQLKIVVDCLGNIPLFVYDIVQGAFLLLTRMLGVDSKHRF